MDARVVVMLWTEGAVAVLFRPPIVCSVHDSEKLSA